MKAALKCFVTMGSDLSRRKTPVRFEGGKEKWPLRPWKTNKALTRTWASVISLFYVLKEFMPACSIHATYCGQYQKRVLPLLWCDVSLRGTKVTAKIIQQNRKLPKIFLSTLIDILFVLFIKFSGAFSNGCFFNPCHFQFML